MQNDRRKTRIFAAVVFLGFAVFLFARGGFVGVAGAEETIKIGVICPMTGSGAQWGERMSSGALLRAEEENAAGGINGKKIKIVVGDHKGIPREGVAAAQKLIHVDHVAAFECTYSGVVMAAIPVAAQNKTVLLNTAALNPGIRDGGEWIYSIMPLADLESKFQAEFARNELGLKKAAILYVNNAFGASMAKRNKEDWLKVGGELVAYEAHPQGGQDFRSQIAKIKAQKPELIFLPSYYMEMGLIVKQAKEMGLTGAQFISYAGAQQPQFLEIAGEAAEGYICTVAGWDPNDPRPIVQDFKKNIKAKYGVEAEMYGAMTYDGIKLFAEVMRKGGTTREAVRDGMSKVQNFNGVTGTNVNFDKDGMVVKRLTLNIVKDGKWVTYMKK